jgi:iron(III) transport system permease protein
MPLALREAGLGFALRERNRARLNLWSILLAAVLGAAFLIVLAPALFLAVTSFHDKSDGGLTFGNYVSAFAHPRHLTALANTIALGAASSSIGLALALPLAWAVSRSDMPLQGLVHFGAMAAFVLPPYLSAIGWILLAGPNAGILNKVWMALTGSDTGLLNIFSFWGLAAVTAFHCFPYVFVFVSSALALVPSDLEDAGKMAGAKPLRIALAITLPAVAPALIAALAVAFLEAITLFGPAALIGIPARVNVAPAQIWQFFEYPIRLEAAAAFSMALLALSLAIAALQRGLLGGRSYAILGGRSERRQRVRLGLWRWPLFGYCSLAGILTAGLPSLILLQCALSKAWGRGLSFDNFTLGNFSYVLHEQTGLAGALFHSAAFSATVASLALLCGFATASWTLGSASLLTRPVRFVFMLPLALPGIVIGVAIYATFGGAPFYLHGTAAIVILALLVRPLGVAFSSSASALSAISREFGDAARLAGATGLQVFRFVTAPMLRDFMIGLWLIIFIAALRELSSVIFLAGPNTRLISTALIDLMESGKFEAVAALGLVLLALCASAAALGRRYLGPGFMVS